LRLVGPAQIPDIKMQNFPVFRKNAGGAILVSGRHMYGRSTAAPQARTIETHAVLAKDLRTKPKPGRIRRHTTKNKNAARQTAEPHLLLIVTSLPRCFLTSPSSS
jgi:hypothetical protein